MSDQSLAKELSKQKKKYARLLEGFKSSMSTLPDAVIVLTKNLEVEWCNDTAEDWFGIDFPRDFSRKLVELVDNNSLRGYIKQRGDADPLDIVSPADHSRQLRIRLVMYRRGRFLLQARDVSKLKELEQVRQDFVANASHELRTPLTIVHGYLEMMKEHGIGNGENWEEVIEQMHRQTSRIKTIVEDMLLLSKLESDENRDNWRFIDVLPVLETMLQDARALSGSKRQNIVLEAEGGNLFRCDPEDLNSLFSNLISNAVRYTPADGQIKITWWVTKRGGYFSVEDTGIGIDQEHISRLTERFYRVDTGRSRDTGGTGLGLAIVYHVLRRHGGVLNISSNPGEGSTFTCHFPPELLKKTDLVLGAEANG